VVTNSGDSNNSHVKCVKEIKPLDDHVSKHTKQYNCNDHKRPLANRMKLTKFVHDDDEQV